LWSETLFGGRDPAVPYLHAAKLVKDRCFSDLDYLTVCSARQGSDFGMLGG